MSINLDVGATLCGRLLFILFFNIDFDKVIRATTQGRPYDGILSSDLSF